MRTVFIGLIAALGMTGAINATALAAPTLHGIDADHAERAQVIPAGYYWHHHRYEHRRWYHAHWSYY
jgi:hypothetical protein